MSAADERAYRELRPLLFSIAYRMLGSTAEAEDVVQEAFLRFRSAADGEDVRAPKAYLTTVATRLSIDRLRSARVRREHYVGTWLPEPIILDEDLEAVTESDAADTADSLSLAFLVLLERLTPLERAVFLLRDVFDHSYREIAEIVGKREDNVRPCATARRCAAPPLRGLTGRARAPRRAVLRCGERRGRGRPCGYPRAGRRLLRRRGRQRSRRDPAPGIRTRPRDAPPPRVRAQPRRPGALHALRPCERATRRRLLPSGWVTVLRDRPRRHRRSRKRNSVDREPGETRARQGGVRTSESK